MAIYTNAYVNLTSSDQSKTDRNINKTLSESKKKINK